MARLLLALLLLPVVWGTVSAQADAAKGIHAMAADMCRCVDSIPADATDALFMAGYRACLDAAVAAHPEVLKAMGGHIAPDGSHPGYRLGLLLAIAMDLACPGKANTPLKRLQQRGAPASPLNS